MAAVADPLLAGRAAEAGALLQAAALLLAEVLGLHLAVLGTALVLVILAGLAGGPAAAVAVTGFLAGISFFLAFDHALRELQSRPSSETRLLGTTAHGRAQSLRRLSSPAWRRGPAGATRSLGTSAQPVAVGGSAAPTFWLFLLALGGRRRLALARLFRGAQSGAVLFEPRNPGRIRGLLEPPPLDGPVRAARGRVIGPI
jgi:hypothetical protein